MDEPTVADMMTRPVITVVPDSPFKELVGIMIAHDLDALPVIDLAGRPAGIIDDLDMLTKVEFHGGADHPPLLAGIRRRARWHKSSGLTAADIMTTPPATITQTSPLRAAVRKLTRPALRHLCAVDHTGHLVGIISRYNVLRLFLRGDNAILADIEHEATAVSRTGQVNAQVVNGVVTLHGKLPLRSTVENLCRTTHRIPGVITVHNNLRYDVDDYMITGL